MAWPPANQIWECSGCGLVAEWHPWDEGGYYPHCDCSQRGSTLLWVGYEKCDRCQLPLPRKPSAPTQEECRCLRCGRCRGRIIGSSDEKDHPKYGGCENQPECSLHHKRPGVP